MEVATAGVEMVVAEEVAVEIAFAMLWLHLLRNIRRGLKSGELQKKEQDKNALRHPGSKITFWHFDRRIPSQSELLH